MRSQNINISRYSNGEYVSIIPSANSFISYNYGGEKDIYTPSKITLTPNFSDGINFLKWQYSTDGGETFNDVVDSKNGVSIDRQTHVLTLESSSDFFAKNISAVSFKLLSDTKFYDVASIGKDASPSEIYKVSQSQIKETSDKISLIATDEELGKYRDSATTISHKVSELGVLSDGLLYTAVQNKAVIDGVEIGLYKDSARYATGSLVVYNGRIYKCISQSSGTLPTDISSWKDLTSEYGIDSIKESANFISSTALGTQSIVSDVLAKKWDSQTGYTVGDIVWYDGKIYKNIKSYTSDPSIMPTNSTYWTIALTGSLISQTENEIKTALQSAKDYSDTSISGVSQKADKISSTVAGVKSTADSALSKANANASNISKTNNNVSSAVNRISTLEQTSSGLTSTVSSVEKAVREMDIGGRNLLRGTADMAKGSGSHESGTFRLSTVNGGNSYELVDDKPVGVNVNKSVKFSDHSGLTQNGDLSAGTYTFSVWLKGKPGEVVTLQVCWYNGIKDHRMKMTVTTDGWFRATATKVLPEDHENISVAYVYLNDGDYLLVSAPKLERGTKATDWTPAPEDVETELASANSKITQNADAIDLKVSTSDFNGDNLVSLINLSSEGVTIKANKIKLEGLVSANENFKILTDGSIEAKNANLSGTIMATSGKIGGWDVTELEIKSIIHGADGSALSYGINSSGDSASPVFYAGHNESNGGSHTNDRFAVYSNGDIFAKSITLDGGKIHSKRLEDAGDGVHYNVVETLIENGAITAKDDTTGTTFKAIGGYLSATNLGLEPLGYVSVKSIASDTYTYFESMGISIDKISRFSYSVSANRWEISDGKGLLAAALSCSSISCSGNVTAKTFNGYTFSLSKYNNEFGAHPRTLIIIGNEVMNRNISPVWRLRNPNTQERVWTKSTSERDNLVKNNWTNDGVNFYAF
jgi:hypothetical protein